MRVTLVILAAGIGSRYGAGVKQLEAVGPSGELIIDYSIHDAIEAGFNRIVYIVRKEIYEDFQEVIGRRLEPFFQARGVEASYVMQELVDPPEGRTKPWGTGQAVLSCRDVLDGPFAVINADDYYGRDAFRKAYEFLSQPEANEPARYGMIGYRLKNTLSNSGGVTRGICLLDAAGKLIGIHETHNILKTETGAALPDGTALDIESLVSMNFWLLPSGFLEALEIGFPCFRERMEDPLKDEYLLPTIVDARLKDGVCSVQVLPSADSWFGITYKADTPAVREAFRELYRQGVYQDPLWQR